MRKKQVLFLLLLASLVLFACEPELYKYDYKEVKESVIRVELINYNNPDAKMIKREPDFSIPFDFNKMTIIEVLAEDRMDGFLKELSNFDYYYVSKHLDSPQGLCFRLVYKNGDFDLVCQAEYSARFKSNGDVLEIIGSGLGEKNSLKDHFKELVNKYFNTKN